MEHESEKITVCSDYIRIDRPAGYEVELIDATDYVDKLASACDDAGVRNVLIVGPKTNVRLSTMDLLELGGLIAAAHLKIAMVERHDAPVRDVEFLENVAWNRGGLIEFFDDEASALEWLGVCLDERVGQ